MSASRRGITATICMPDSAPVMKVDSTRRLGANVELVKGVYDDAHDRALEIVSETGATFIHPYDDDYRHEEPHGEQIYELAAIGTSDLHAD